MCCSGLKLEPWFSFRTFLCSGGKKDGHELVSLGWGKERGIHSIDNGVALFIRGEGGCVWRRRDRKVGSPEMLGLGLGLRLEIGHMA
jgi:hypothetical protein